MQDDVTELQASAHLVTTPIYSLHTLPPNAIITDPPTPAGWTAAAWRSSAGAPTAVRIIAREAARRRRAAHPKKETPT